jgi:hypothetical protein
MELTLTLTGVAPLIIQSDQLVDPLDRVTREIKVLTGKKTRKTDDDIAEIGRLEFYGSLYHDAEVGPYLPGDNIQASLREGGSFAGRLGRAIERAVIVLTDMNPLEYKGPRELDKLWADTYFRFRRSVVVQRARTMRTRPIFREWQVQAKIRLATDILNMDDFERTAEAAGAMVGIGTWRPRYGRYTVKVGRS